MFRAFFVAAAVTVSLGAGVQAQERKPAVNLAEAMRLEFGPDTTVIDGPLGVDGLPDYLEALNRKLSVGVAPAENFWALACVAMGNVDRSPPAYLTQASWWLGVEIPREPRLLGLGEANGIANSVAGAFAEQMDRTLERPWKRADYPGVVRWIEANRTLLTEMAEASQRPKAYAPLVSLSEPAVATVMVPYAQSTRWVARLLTSRAMLRIEEGDRDGAWSDLVTLLRIARHVESGPSLIDRLIGYSLRSMAYDGLAQWLSRVELSDEALDARRKELAPLLEVTSLVGAIDRERYSYADTVLSLAAGKFPPQELSSDVPHLSVVGGETWRERFNGELLKRTETAVTRFLIASADVNATLRHGNALYDDVVVAMGLATHAERSRRLAAIQARIRADREEASDPAVFVTDVLLAPPGSPSLMPGKALAGLFLSSALPCERVYTSAIARSRTLEAAFRFRIAARRTGTLPASLADLTDGENGPPTDPFTGGPLRMKSDERGIVIWSIGANGKDDGGRFNHEVPGADDLRTILVLP